MSKSTVKVVEIDTNPAVKSLKDLRKELMEYKNQMANLEEGSDAFLEVANKAGEVKHQIDEISESIKGASADFGDMVGNVTNVAAGITGAFQAVAGGLQAMGVESEAIDKTIAKMQGLMAITQGLGSIDTAIKSLDKLRNSITSTTAAAKLMKAALQPKVFLAITAVTTGLSAAVGKLFSNATKLADAEKARAEAYREMKLQEQIRKQEEYNTALKRELDIKESIIIATYAGNDVETQKALLNLYKEQKKELEAQLKNRYRDDEKIDLSIKIRQAEKELEKYTEADQEYWDLLIDKIIPWKYDLEHIKPLTDDEIKDLEKRIEEYDKLIGETQFQLDKALAIEEVLKKKREDDEKTAAAKAAADAAAREAEAAAERKKNYDDEVKTIEYLTTLYKELYGEDSVAFKEEELNLAERALSNIKSYFGETSEEYKNQLLLVLDLRKAFEELTAVKEENLSNEEIELALENDRLKEMAKGWLHNEETAIETFNRISEELKLALDRDLITQTQYDTAVKNLTKERTRYIVEQSIKTFSAASDFVTTLLDGIADQQDENNKEGFEKSKKLQIASATIGMLTGITNAIAGLFTTKSGPWDIALAAIQAATIAASGAMQIQKIKNTKFDGGGAANVSAGAVNNMIVPPVQFSQAVQGASTQGAITNQKVYVTESDIVNTIGKVNVQESENTY